MKNLKSLFLSTVLLVLFSVSNIYAQSSSSIKGTVKDPLGEGLAGANVKIVNTKYGASADLEGNYEIKNVPTGTHTVKVSFVGFKPVTKNITVSPNKTTIVNLVLQDSNNVLDEVLIKGQSLKLKNSTTTVNVVKQTKIKNLMMTAEQPLRLVENIAGVNVPSYAQAGVADNFSVRGFNGGHSGGAGVEVDGISLNEAEGHSDGYADINVLIPLNIGNVKVYKGPSSVLFGRFGQGGTLAIETRKGGEYSDFSLKGGSYGTIDAQYAQGSAIKLGDSGRELQVNFAGQVYKTDGYVKKHSEWLKGNIDGRISYEISDKTDISLAIRGHKSNWNAPGYIPEKQFLDDNRRNKPHPLAQNDGGAKTLLSQRLDVNHKISEDVKLLVFGYALQQDFNRFAKFSYTPTGQTERFNTRDVFAFGGSLNGNSKLGDKALDWTTGLEIYTEDTDRHRWKTNFRKREAKTEQRNFNIQSFSAFIQGEIEVHKLFRPSIGVRFDTYSGDFSNNDPGKTATSGKIENLSHFSPKLGFRSTLADGFDFRASASNGFTLPNSALKYDSSADLDPAELWQYEVGFSYKNEMLDFDIAGYILNSSKEIITLPGTDELTNAGKTRRSGIEASLDMKITEGLTFSGTTAFSGTKIIKSSANEGKSLTGLPKSIVNLGLTYTSPIGLGADINVRNVGESYINGDNTKKYDGYSVTNTVFFYNFNKMFANKGRVFLAINNLFNEKYAGSMWEGYGTINYAPAPTRNFSVGVNYSF